MINLIAQKKYTVLDGILPNNNYGDSLATILRNRFNHLIFNTNLFKRSVKVTNQWIQKNKKDIVAAFINNQMNHVLINYISKPISLQEAINKKFIQIQPIKPLKKKSLNSTCYTISIPTYKINKEKINFESLTNNLSKELLITFAVTLTKNSLELYNLDLYTVLQLSIIIGLVRGSIENASNVLVEENASLSRLPLNCIVEILTETSTAISFHLLENILSIGRLYALRGFFKYFFEQLIQGYCNLINITDLSLEMLKSTVKEGSIAYLSSTFGRKVLFGKILGEVLGGYLATLLSVSFINILIDQAFYKLSFNSQ